MNRHFVIRMIVGGAGLAAGVAACSGNGSGNGNGNPSGEGDAQTSDATASSGGSSGALSSGSSSGTSSGSSSGASSSGSSSGGSSGSSSGSSDAGADSAVDATVAVADGGDGGDGGDSAVAWNVSVGPGLVLWLDSTRGLNPTDDAGADGGTIFSWADQSGYGNNATGVGGPTVVNAALGGMPVVRFNGTSDYLIVADSPSLEFGTGDFLIAEVAQHTTPTDAGVGYGFLFSKQDETHSPYPGPALIANTGSLTTGIEAQVAAGIGDVISGSTGYNNGTPFYVTMHRFAVPSDAGADAAVATLDLRIGGADAGSATGVNYADNVSAGDGGPGSWPLYIGGNNQLQDVRGDIAEVIAIKGAVDDANLEALEAYLKSKYGL